MVVGAPVPILAGHRNPDKARTAAAGRTLKHGATIVVAMARYCRVIICQGGVTGPGKGKRKDHPMPTDVIATSPLLLQILALAVAVILVTYLTVR